MTSFSYTTSVQDQDRLRRSLAALLLRQMPLLSLANLTLAAAVTTVLWEKLPHAALMLWLLCTVTATIARLGASALIKRAIAAEREIENQTMFFSTCSLLTGLSWGVLCFLCIGQLGVAASVVPLLATSGLVAGAAAGSSSVMLGFILYCLAAMLPIIVAMAQLNSREGYILAAFSALHLLFTLYAGRTNNRLIRDNVMDNLALEQANIRANTLAEHLRQLSSLDQVTDLANRRGFDQALNLEWRRAQRNNHPLCMLLCDIDYFKNYNDSLGHQAGDRCLYAVAQALHARCARAGDVVARFGGEEFAIIAPNISLEQARIFAEIICAAVSALNIPHPDSRAAKVVTITVGGAVLEHGNYVDATDLIEAADASMYRAKAMGRNRALVADADQLIRVTALAGWSTCRSADDHCFGANSA